MPCRVGITQNPSNRKQRWENKVVGLRNWREEFVGSKSDAQRKENSRFASCQRARNRGKCHAHHGGGDPAKYGWYVYEFDYLREKKPTIR